MTEVTPRTSGTVVVSLLAQEYSVIATQKYDNLEDPQRLKLVTKYFGTAKNSCRSKKMYDFSYTLSTNIVAFATELLEKFETVLGEKWEDECNGNQRVSNFEIHLDITKLKTRLGIMGMGKRRYLNIDNKDYIANFEPNTKVLLLSGFWRAGVAPDLVHLSHPACDPEVILHEMGHFIMDTIGNMEDRERAVMTWPLAEEEALCDCLAFICTDEIKQRLCPAAREHFGCVYKYGKDFGWGASSNNNNPPRDDRDSEGELFSLRKAFHVDVSTGPVMADRVYADLSAKARRGAVKYAKEYAWYRSLRCTSAHQLSPSRRQRVNSDLRLAVKSCNRIYVALKSPAYKLCTLYSSAFSRMRELYTDKRTPDEALLNAIFNTLKDGSTKMYRRSHDAIKRVAEIILDTESQREDDGEELGLDDNDISVMQLGRILENILQLSNIEWQPPPSRDDEVPGIGELSSLLTQEIVTIV